MGFVEELLKGVVEELIHLRDGVKKQRAVFGGGEDDTRAVGLLAETGVDNGFEKELELFKAKSFGAHQKVPAELSVKHSIIGWFEALVVQNVALLVPLRIQMLP